jgi:hemerythrin
MALIEWNSSLSVGIELIDNQHKKLVALINDLNEAMKLGKGSTIIKNIIDELISYTISHFATEEKYFKQFNYADTQVHVAEHEAFVRKVSDFVDDLNEARLSLSISVMNFLRDWLKNHIMVVDKKYAELFIANGVK